MLFIGLADAETQPGPRHSDGSSSRHHFGRSTLDGPSNSNARVERDEDGDAMLLGDYDVDEDADEDADSPNWSAGEYSREQAFGGRIDRAFSGFFEWTNHLHAIQQAYHYECLLKVKLVQKFF